MKVKSRISRYVLIITAFIVFVGGCKKEDDKIITDADGNVYSSVEIGSQVWMVENLKTTKYSDGTDIPLITDNTDWHNATSPGYCWYDNNISNKDPFGALYNWYAVNIGKLCPAGWHVATKNDWEELCNFLGGMSVAGGKLKTTGTIEGNDGLWYQPNNDATNETGFSALPGGSRGSGFDDLNYGGIWWSSTEYSSERAYYFYINNFDGTVGTTDDGGSISNGFSVRCVKD